MNAVIVFGPIPGEARRSLIGTLEASEADLNLFVGTTIEDVLANAPALRLSPSLSPCFVQFEHDVPGFKQQEVKGTDVRKWPQTFWTRIRSELRVAGYSEGEEPEFKFYLSEGGGCLAAFRWGTVATRHCIRFCRLVELAYREIASEDSTVHRPGQTG